MAVQVKQGSILGAVASPELDLAVQQSATAETNYGLVRIPPGIQNGVAQLEKCYFEKYKSGPNQGKPYFRCEASVVQPYSIATPDGEIVVYGLKTSIMVPCCDTKTQAGEVTTAKQHFDEVMNEMRKLGGEDFTASVKKVSDLEPLAEILQQARPYTKFSTSVRKARPNTKESDGVWENWNGAKGLEDYVPPVYEKLMKDSSSAPSSNGSAPHAASATTPATVPAALKARTQAAPLAAAPAAQAAPLVVPPVPEAPDDIDALLTLANGQDPDAQTRLMELAVAAGTEEAVVKAAESWEAVVAMIQPAEAAALDYVPKKGDVRQYFPIDPKTKQPSKTSYPCSVVLIDETAKTVTLKNNTNPKILYSKVPWADLMPA